MITAERVAVNARSGIASLDTVSDAEFGTDATSNEQPAAAVLDVDGIERDLADVELALERLDAGTYWTDEASGEPLDDEVLARRPTARRAEQP